MNEEFSLYELTRRDPRYPLAAYCFVKNALAYAADSRELDLQAFEENAIDGNGEPMVERHFTGQQLCHAIRSFAVNQFGYLAKVVLSTWNVDSTSCFGDLVYNMIDAEMMKKSDQDRREDFDDVYDFNDVFEIDVDISSSTAIL